jgi:hypothetical protein
VSLPPALALSAAQRNVPVAFDEAPLATLEPYLLNAHSTTPYRNKTYTPFIFFLMS